MNILIAGVDPGSTIGISILDLNGNLIKITSFRNKGVDFVIKKLIKFGKIAIIGSDVNPVPKLIEKISKSLGCKLVLPRKSLTSSQKHNIIGRFFEKRYRYKNKHEKDSLCAAIIALRFYNVLFNKIDNKIKDKRKASKIKRLVLLKNVSIKEALKWA